ncbi:MAG: outer membrane beta-barrel protein [Treponema sp.]|jgi:TolB-like protein|nr:outer membrane beta-barrel protein [Treponema sp.]
MKKIPALCLSALLCTGMAAAKDNLAVLPFTGGAGTEGETIAELFSFSNELREAFALIPRTSITQAADSEQRFQGTGMTDPDTIAEIGKQLGARYIVAGNIAKLGNRNLLIISILKIDDLRQIAGDIQTYSKIEEIRDKLPAMARNIIAATRLESFGAGKLAVVPVAFQDEGVDQGTANTLAQILSIYLIRSGKYAVYPRTATLEQVDAEYRTQDEAASEENRVDIGKGENPRLVLSVAARQLGRLNMFNASIINLESGEQTAGDSEEYYTLDDGIMVMERLAGKLTGARVKNMFFRSDAWENSRLYAGLRLGVSPRFYGLSQDIGGGRAETGVSFEAAMQISAYLLSLFGVEAGLQTELWFGTDTVSYSGTDAGGDFTASFGSSVLEIPLLAKLSYRISGKFVVSLFTGPYFSIPLGKLEYTSGGETGSYKSSVPAGWLVGAAPGMRLGPGTLFADIRYGGDFGNTGIRDDKGVLSVYSRGMVSFTLGYELGFIRR